MITRDIGTVERAFQLARSGECKSVEEISKRLSKEGYEAVALHLTGTAIRSQLKKAWSESATSDEIA